MKTLALDTDPETEERLVQGYRRMSAAEKLQCVEDLVQLARHLGMQDLKARYPSAGEHELRMRLASRWLEADLMRKAYGWDPDREGF